MNHNANETRQQEYVVRKKGKIKNFIKHKITATIVALMIIQPLTPIVAEAININMPMLTHTNDRLSEIIQNANINPADFLNNIRDDEDVDNNIEPTNDDVDLIDNPADFLNIIRDDEDEDDDEQETDVVNNRYLEMSDVDESVIAFDSSVFIRAEELRNQPRRHPNLTADEALQADYEADDLQYLVHGEYTGDLYYDGLAFTLPSLAERPLHPWEEAVAIKGLHPDLDNGFIPLDFLPGVENARNTPSVTGFRRHPGFSVSDVGTHMFGVYWFEVQVNGTWHVAFCIDFLVPGPVGIGQILGVSPYNNEQARRALWFGYGGGSGHWARGVGSTGNTLANRRYLATTIVLTYINTGNYRGNSNMHGTTSPANSNWAAVRELWGRVTGGGELPDHTFRLNRGDGSSANLSTANQSAVQRSQNVQIQAHSSNRFQIPVPTGVSLINETNSGRSNTATGSARNVTVHGNDTIRFEAPLNSNATVNTGRVHGSIPEFAPLRFSTPAGVQNLGMGLHVDPTGFIQLTVDFTPQEAKAYARKLSEVTGDPIPGTVFEFYLNGNRALLTTGNNGWTPRFDNIPAGETFRIREYSVPTPYLVDRTWHEFTAIAGHEHHHIMRNERIRGGAAGWKIDAELDINAPQGDATLADAVIAFYNRTGRTVDRADGSTVPNNGRMGTTTTDAQGRWETPNDFFEAGNFEAIEIQAPNGYLVNNGWSASITVTTHQQIVEVPRSNDLYQEVIRGGIEVQKVDAELDLNVPQGDATLQGATIAIISRNTNPVVTLDGRTIEPGAVTGTMTTNAEGVARTPNNYLPFGTYELREIASPRGYLLNEDWRYTVEIREHHQVVRATYDLPQYIIRGDVEIQKWDIELDTSEAMAGTSLADIEFEITNRSVNPSTIDDVIFDPDEVIMSIFSFWCDGTEAYVARTTGRTLPYGTYEITEVRGNTYYLLEEELDRPPLSFTFEIREDNEVVRLSVDGEDMVYKNQVIRSDIEFNKIAEGTNARLPYTPFLATNRASGETHVIITDRNGVFNSHYSINGGRTPENTNQNNHLLEYVERGELIPIESMNLYTNTWFGTGEFGTVAPIHPTMGAFHYGWYDVVELASESNQHFEMLEFDFYVSRHIMHNEIINLGTLTNHWREHMDIRTYATVGDGERTFEAGETVYMHDEIHVWHSRVNPWDMFFPRSLDVFLSVREPGEDDRLIYEFDTIHYTVRSHENRFNVTTSEPIDTSDFADDSIFFFWARAYDRDGNLAYEHNAEGTIEEQTIRWREPEMPELPEIPTPEVSIATQAHTGDGGTQYFTWGEEIEAHDDIQITHTNIPIGTMRAFRAYLFAELPESYNVEDFADYFGEGLYESDVVNSGLLYVTDYNEYEVIADIMDKHVDTVVDTSNFPAETRFFWAETAYHRIDDDGEYIWEEDYRHNFNGEDGNQTLTPIIPEPETPSRRPNLPTTGAVSNGRIMFVIGVVTLATGSGVVIWKRKLADVSRVIKLRNKK